MGDESWEIPPADACLSGVSVLQAVFDGISAAVVFFGPDGRASMCNRAAAELFGLPAPQFLGLPAVGPAWCWIGEDGLEIPAESHPVYRVAATAKAARNHILGIQKARDRDPLWVRYDAEPVLRGGDFVGIVATLADITDLRQSIAVLRRRSEEREQWLEKLERINSGLEQKLIQHSAELEKRNKEMIALASKTIAAMESDRKVLSKELHDGIGGTLAAVKHRLEGRIEQMDQPPGNVAISFERLNDHLLGAIKDTRHISKKLRPLVLDDFGLKAAINENIKDFQEFYPGIEVRHTIRISEDKLSEEIKTVLYRVTQEALTNVGKHSSADLVKIELKRVKNTIFLRVEDNGRGFDAERTLARRGLLSGYGLLSMKERVEICRGQFAVDSRPESGTLINIRIPLDIPEQLPLF